MAVAIVSPYPAATAAVARQQARECLRGVIRGTVTDARLDALGEAASAQVERFAPDAPQSVRNESTLRLAAWMHAREPRPVQGLTIASIRLDFRERFYSPNALANSGARAMLQPWRTRRALPVEEAS
ncbi:MAG: hypothetical protein OXF78_09385 [Rhodospirillales bacterium]|nr:hypothetical protein [Rhodospirillales bacterium]